MKYYFIFAAMLAVTDCVKSVVAETAAVDALEQQRCIDKAEAGIGKEAMRQQIDACRNAVKAKRDVTTVTLTKDADHD